MVTHALISVISFVSSKVIFQNVLVIMVTISTLMVYLAWVGIANYVFLVLLYVKSNLLLNLDVNECLTMYYDCGDHAECINTNGSFLCACDRGFTSDGNNLCIGM